MVGDVAVKQWWEHVGTCVDMWEANDSECTMNQLALEFRGGHCPQPSQGRAKRRSGAPIFVSKTLPIIVLQIRYQGMTQIFQMLS